MKRILLLTILSVFVLGNIILFSEYLDVGDDPEKISITDIYEIPNSNLYTFKEFSPNGDFLAFKINGSIKSIILKNDGTIYKKIDDYFVSWTNNTNEIIAYEWLGDNSDKNLKVEIFNLKTGQKKYLNLYVNLMKANNIRYNTYDNKLIFGVDDTGDLYEYDFITDHSEKLITVGFKIEDYFVGSYSDVILIKEHDTDGSDRFEILKFNLKSKKLTKLFPELSDSVNFYNLRSKQKLISFEPKGRIYIIDTKGNIISNKIKLFPFKNPNDKKRTFTYDMAPNGKLVCVTNGFLKEEMDDGFTEADLFIFDLNGNWKRLTNTENRLEFITQWSPNGDKIVYFDNKSKKYYLASISTKN